MTSSEQIVEEWELFDIEADTPVAVPITEPAVSSNTESTESDSSDTDKSSKSHYKLCPQLQAKKEKAMMKRMKKKEQARLHKEEMEKMHEKQPSSDEKARHKHKRHRGKSKKATNNVSFQANQARINMDD